MSCEMCGKFAGPDLEECEVDGAIMFLCRSCAKFGDKVSKFSQDDIHETEVSFVKSRPDGQGSSVSHVKVRTGTSHRSTSPKKRRYDQLYGDEVLIDDYGEAIKNARKKKGWSLEDFAQMINEKASLLQKIEKSEFNPPENLIVKIERKLNISLREEVAAPTYSSITSKKETTLGDVVKLKKKKK